MTSISANPGQIVDLAVQVIDGYGARVDGYVPQVISVFTPPLGAAATGFPAAMDRIGVGLYSFSLSIPAGSTSLGTYIASTLHTNPVTNGQIWEIHTIHVALPFGNSSVSPL